MAPMSDPCLCKNVGSWKSRRRQRSTSLGGYGGAVEGPHVVKVAMLLAELRSVASCTAL